jgi:hypothetical protein
MTRVAPNRRSNYYANGMIVVTLITVMSAFFVSNFLTYDSHGCLHPCRDRVGNDEKIATAVLDTHEIAHGIKVGPACFFLPAEGSLV